MPVFSRSSLAQLATCDERLQRVANATISIFDFSVIEGHRGKEAQEAAFKAGNSQVHWPHGKHNGTPSLAFDIMPYPVDWSDTAKNHERSVYLAGYIMAIAAAIGIKLRYGGDWDGDHDMRNEKFRDYGHFELIDP